MSSPLSKAELVGRTKAIQEIDSSFRIYIREWLYEGRQPSESEAQAEMDQRFKGRVRQEDLRVMKDWNDSWLILTRRWTVAAEAKNEILGAEILEAFVQSGYEAQMVARNSRAEHVLAQYGVILLPKEKA